MAQFTKYGDIDNGIQQRMGNQSPSADIRRDAIRNVLKTLYAKVDLNTGKRTKSFYHIVDGTPLNLTALISDLKTPSDLRYKAAGEQVVEFPYIDDDKFVRDIDQNRLLNQHSIAYDEGNQFLKINAAQSQLELTINQMASLTDNGTFTVIGDASNLTAQTVRTLDNPSALSFDITDVTQTAGIEAADMTSLDLTKWLGLGRMKGTFYIPDVTAFTNIQILLGSSSSNYYTFTITTQDDGTDFVDGFNRGLFNWETATTTGSPDVADITYIAIKANYESGYGPEVGFQVEKLTMQLPIYFDLVYFSQFTGFTAEGDMVDEIDGTNTNDMVLVPAQYENYVVLKSVQYLAPYAWGDDAAGELKLISGELKEEETLLKLSAGSRPKKAIKKLKLRTTRRVGRRGYRRTGTIIT